MRNLLHWLSRRRYPYKPLITVELSKSRLLYNLNEFRKRAPNGMVAPILKSNAYGHGLIEIARVLNYEKNIPFCIVDSYFEAVALRTRGFKLPLLVIGYARPETIMASRLDNTVFAMTSLATLKSIANVERFTPIQLKIDTGMHRQGILPSELQEALNIIGCNSDLKLEGVCSHLSDADNADPSWTEVQIRTWNEIVHKIRAAFPLIKYTHLSATDGHRFSSEIDANVSRLGIGLYGVADTSLFIPPLLLKPVLQMKTVITGIKKIKRDDTVGQGNTYKAERDSTIAMIPAGYNEGIDRRLSNKGFVLLGHSEMPCPIIGRISMNITSIDVSRDSSVVEGKGVIVISNDPHKPNSVQAIAKICDTVPHEITIHIAPHLKRIVVE